VEILYEQSLEFRTISQSDVL